MVVLIQVDLNLLLKVTQRISSKKIQMANVHMKRYSKSLLTREMQIKPTIRYYSIPIRMAIIKKSN